MTLSQADKLNIQFDSLDSLHNKFKQLKDAQKSWKEIAIDNRISKIKKFNSLLEENKQRLAEDLHQENGKPIEEAINEIKAASYRIQYFLDHVKNTLEEKTVNQVEGVNEILSFEPLGVVANISAWNYPYLVGVNVLIPALLAGNTVLYKPSEYASLAGKNIAALLYQSGIPEDVFIPAYGDAAIGAEILNLNCDGYFFTGSYATGKLIAEKVANKLVPVGLELGGKDAIYVMDDVVDVDKTAAGLVEGVFYNNGQSCCAVERIYIHKNIADELTACFIEHAGKLPRDVRLTRPQQLDVLKAQIQDACDKGARLVLGGNARQENGAYLEPTVLINVNHTMDLMREESFGPIIGIQVVSDDDEALGLMDDSEYGLTAGIYGRDQQRARNLLKQLDVGTGYFNCCDRLSPYLPWSGRRHSGLGSTLSYLGILAFVRPKALMIRNK